MRQQVCGLEVSKLLPTCGLVRLHAFLGSSEVHRGIALVSQKIHILDPLNTEETVGETQPKGTLGEKRTKEFEGHRNAGTVSPTCVSISMVILSLRMISVPL